MLEYLHLRKWQRHADLQIDLEMLTSITGASNSGKSSILRAIKWVMTNKPTGSRFIKRGENECSVSLTVDGHDVLRRRGVGDNSYRLDGDAYEPDATRTPVPAEIVRLFNVSECNYQSQREGTLYWFGLTDGEVAKELDKVVDLSLIDRVMKNINSQVRKQEKELDDARQQWEVAKSECDGLQWATEADEALSAIERLRVVSREQEQEIADLQQLLHEIEGLQGQDVGERPDEALEELAELFRREKTLAGQISALERLIDEIAATEKEVGVLTTRWQQETKNMRDAVGNTCPVCRRPL